MAIFDIFNSIAGWGSKEELYGTKPIIPQYPTSEKIGADLLSANLKNLPEAKRLAAATNQANAANYQATLRASIPGYDEIVRTTGENALSAARGELSPGEQKMLQRTTAELAKRGGYQGSQVADWSAAENIGLTMRDIQSTFDTWLRRSQELTTPGFMDVSSMFLSPEMQIELSDATFNRDLLAAGVQAAPDPAKRGILDLEMGILGMALGAYSGGPGYTQSYQKNYGNTFGGGSGGEPAGQSGGKSGGFLKMFGFGGGQKNYGGTLGGGSGGTQWGGPEGTYA